MFIISLLTISLSVCTAFQSRFENTMFYSTPVQGIDLKNIEVEELKTTSTNVFKKISKKKAKVQLSKPYFNYYKNTTELNKKIIIKMASLGILDNLSLKINRGEPYSMLYKKDRSFNLETLAYVPVKYDLGLSVVKDFAKYNEWALRHINVKRNGSSGKYFIDINSLLFMSKNKSFYTRVSMNTIFKGKYKMDLLIGDQTDDKISPTLTLKMKEPSKLAKAVEGIFYFIVVPGEPYFLIYFTGKTEVNWAIYNFLPESLVRGEVLERVYTLLENIEYRSTTIKKPIVSK